MFLTVFSTYPLVPRRLFTSLNSLLMKSKRQTLNDGGVEKLFELTGVTRKNCSSYVTFASVIEARRDEAKRTIVVQVCTVSGKLPADWIEG